jgi:hypothetical protein
MHCRGKARLHSSLEELRVKSIAVSRPENARRQLGERSGPSFRLVEDPNATTNELLKFCKKVLDILTNREQYVSTHQPTNLFRSGIYVRHLVTPFRGVGHRHLALISIQEGTEIVYCESIESVAPSRAGARRSSR